MGCFSEVDKGVVSKRVVLTDVPPEQKPERGYIRMFPRNETRTSVSAHVPPERKPDREHVRQNHPFTKPPFRAKNLPVSFQAPAMVENSPSKKAH